MDTMAMATPMPQAGSSYGALVVPIPAPSPSPSESQFLSYVAYASLYGLGALYLVPSVISWTRMTRNIHTEDKTAVRLFALLGFGAMLRAIAFVLVSAWMLIVSQSNQSKREAQSLHLSYVELVAAWQVLGMVSSFVLMSVFLLIFNTWASMTDQVASTRLSTSYRASTVERIPARLLFIQMVLATSGLQLVSFLLVNAASDSEFLRSLQFFTTILLTLCFFVCIFLLPVYGKHMCELLGKVAEGADRRQRNIRRIAAISTVFCIMRTLSQLLLAFSEYDQLYPDDDTSTPGFRISPKRIMEANPIFFFSSDASSGLLRWVVLLEVVEFPIEWTLLMLLLCVLPSRAVLPSIRGYQPILDTKR